MYTLERLGGVRLPEIFVFGTLSTCIRVHPIGAVDPVSRLTENGGVVPDFGLSKFRAIRGPCPRNHDRKAALPGTSVGISAFGNRTNRVGQRDETGWPIEAADVEGQQRHGSRVCSRARPRGNEPLLLSPQKLTSWRFHIKIRSSAEVVAGVCVSSKHAASDGGGQTTSPLPRDDVRRRPRQ